jgi:hypothetical protein
MPNQPAGINFLKSSSDVGRALLFASRDSRSAGEGWDERETDDNSIKIKGQFAEKKVESVDALNI